MQDFVHQPYVLKDLVESLQGVDRDKGFWKLSEKRRLGK